jgi:hypothetical protein
MSIKHFFKKIHNLYYNKFYNKLTAKSSSTLSVLFGIINVLWIYFFDRLSNGFSKLSTVISIDQWVFIANLTLYSLIALLLISILFGVIGIKKSILSDKRWIVVAIVGILLGVLPLVICKLLGRTWISVLFF